jgi:small subunit ribosomal protein S16
MKKMGRKHRPFFRICAVDIRSPRDGRVIEELGTYDPLIPDTDARTVLNGERVAYWLGVGAQPSDKCRVLIDKYGQAGTHVDMHKAAREKLAQPKSIPDPGEAKVIKPKEEPAAEAAPTEGEAPVTENAAE